MSRADVVAVGSSSSRRCTDNLKQLHGSSPLQYVHSKAGAHHVTATNGLESLRSCSLPDVNVEGSRISGSFKRFHLRIWPEEHGIICPSIDKANCSCRRVNSAAPTTASAQPTLCAETHSSRNMTRWGMKNSTITTMGMS